MTTLKQLHTHTCTQQQQHKNKPNIKAIIINNMGRVSPWCLCVVWVDAGDCFTTTSERPRATERERKRSGRHKNDADDVLGRACVLVLHFIVSRVEVLLLSVLTESKGWSLAQHARVFWVCVLCSRFF